MKRFFPLLLITIFSSKTFALNDNRIGPHNGLLRITGSFHTEVIPQKQGIKVMLLDKDLNNPVTADSTVRTVIQTEAGEWIYICKPKGDYFHCPVDNKLLKNIGTLQVLSKRQAMQGAPADYPLPMTGS